MKLLISFHQFKCVLLLLSLLFGIGLRGQTDNRWNLGSGSVQEIDQYSETNPLLSGFNLEIGLSFTRFKNKKSYAEVSVMYSRLLYQGRGSEQLNMIGISGSFVFPVQSFELVLRQEIHNEFSGTHSSGRAYLPLLLNTKIHLRYSFQIDEQYAVTPYVGVGNFIDFSSDALSLNVSLGLVVNWRRE